MQSGSMSLATMSFRNTWAKSGWVSRAATLRPAALGTMLALGSTWVLSMGCSTQQGREPQSAVGNPAQSSPSDAAVARAAERGETEPSSRSGPTATGSALPKGELIQPGVPAEVRELPTGSKVLQVGDSFAGALGIPLGKMLEARGVHSVLKAKDASYLTDWAWDGELQKQIWKYNPDLVVITLGANELKIGEPEARIKTVKKLVSILMGRPCVWIAIPLWDGPQNGLLEVIRNNVAPCRYLDTNALMDTAHMARIEDGIHPTASAREAWAKLVLEWLEVHREPDGAEVWSLKD
jgi:lysophospholipase L1-like esterase